MLTNHTNIISMSNLLMHTQNSTQHLKVVVVHFVHVCIHGEADHLFIYVYQTSVEGSSQSILNLNLGEIISVPELQLRANLIQQTKVPSHVNLTKGRHNLNFLLFLPIFSQTAVGYDGPQ